MLHTLVQFVQRLVLYKKRRNVDIDKSTRLLRHFGVDFLTKLEARCYLRVGSRGMLNARIIFESKHGLVHIGDRVYIGAHTTIISRERIEIGNDVTMAWGIT